MTSIRANTVNKDNTEHSVATSSLRDDAIYRKKRNRKVLSSDVILAEVTEDVEVRNDEDDHRRKRKTASIPSYEKSIPSLSNLYLIVISAAKCDDNLRKSFLILITMQLL